MDKIQNFLWDKLCDMSGEDVARAFTNFYGNQLLSESLYEFMIDEGYCEDELGLFDEDEEDEDYE